MADNPVPPGGQKLAWWNETTPLTAAPKNHSPWWRGESTNLAIGEVASLSAQTTGESGELLPDIGEELEAEALRLAALEGRGERVTFLSNPPAHKARAKLRMLLPLLLVAGFGLLPLLMPHPKWYHGPDMYHQPYFWIEWAVLTLWVSAIVNWGRAISTKVEQPRIALTKSGIEIHQQGYDLGLVRWDEIDDIFLTAGYVAILPKDTRGLCRRLTFQQSAMTRTNHVLASPMVFLPKSQRAPICIGTYLSITPKELFARINDFRAQNGV